ncbi:MFS transporter [Streptacidiphilus jiangxiensis]|uniref:Major Facilitator Superfamily protein n=1 Tax=Streptacidiphilus jiangxiensis TaxID=235985 RepID=A0A1H7TNB2_STRJI|nr:MFS transporter [Streptacidiphilus jiangxiensis]SEL85337.1 Major Facilitator Superfamily protein [Streptacidiphilus jiangxiensis]
MTSAPENVDSAPRPEPDPEPDATNRLDGASRLRIFAVILVVVLFAEIAALQYTMVASAARQIAPSFPSVGANISWMVIIFGLVGGATTPILGKLSDLWGKRRTMLMTGVSFALGTLICALTHTWWVFLVGRALEAVAISAPTVAYGLFRDILPRRYIPAAIGVIATGLGMSALAAPLIGGALMDAYGWRWLFWFLLIFVGVMMPLMWVVVPESSLRTRQRLDIGGALLLGGGVGLVLVYLSNGNTWGWGRLDSLAYLFGGLAALIAFLLVERVVAEPIMDPKLLFSPRVLVILGAATLGSMVIGIQGYSIPYMLQTPTQSQLHAQILGVALSGSGGQTLPPAMAPLFHTIFNSTLAFGLGATLLAYGYYSAVYSGGVGMLSGAGAGELARKTGPRLPLIIAMTMFTLSTVLYAYFPHSKWQYGLFAAVFGIGFGAFYAACPNLMIEAVPARQQGISAGMLGVVNSLATAVGTGVLTAFLSGHPLKMEVQIQGLPESATGGGFHVIPQLYAFSGYQQGLLVAAGCGAVGLIVALLMRHGRSPATGGEATDQGVPAQRTAA